jgi:hypothetical protein
MQYYSIKADRAEAFLNALSESQEPDLHDYCELVGDGVMFAPATFQPVKAALQKLKSNYPVKPTDKDGNAFEAMAAELVHKNFPQVGPDVKSDMGFWRYLSLAFVRDIIEWRYGKTNISAHRNHYGIGAPKRNFLWKLYYRAEVSLDPSNKKDPYHLSRIQDKDLWESHILAVRPGCIRLYVRAFLKFLYPKIGGKSSIDTKVLRRLASRLNRLRANIYFEAYTSEDEIRTIIKREAAKAHDEVQESKAEPKAALEKPSKIKNAAAPAVSKHPNVGLNA